MIKDTLDSLRVTMSERIGNPFLSACILACVFLNWRLSLLLLADLPYDNKVLRIANLYPTNAIIINDLIIRPAIAGIIWTITWPIASVAINTYWHWMKSNISNAKLWAERKRKLSEAEAAEIYSTIDSQEGKYLELLKERQSRIDSLTREINSLIKLHNAANETIGKVNAELEGANRKAIEGALALTKREEAFETLRSERDIFRRELEEISSKANDVAEFLPGLKEITRAINKAINYQAKESWMWEELDKQVPSYPQDAKHRIFNFLLALGILKKDTSGHVSFGDQYRFTKDRVLGTANYKSGTDSPAKTSIDEAR